MADTQTPEPTTDDGVIAATGAVASSASPQTHRSVSASRPFWPLLIVVVLFATVLLVGGWWGLRQFNRLQAAADLQQQQLVSQGQTGQHLQQQINNLVAQQTAAQLQIGDTDKRVNTLTDKFDTLTATSRADWLLAEADYLLRQADQRLLLERQTSSALALVTAADSILRDLNDPELLVVRKALAQDMAALKLTAVIDRSGIYLRMAALAERVNGLMFVDMAPPTPTLVSTAITVEQSLSSAELIPTWTQRLQHSAKTVLAKLSSYIQVQHHDNPPQALLADEYQQAVKQHLQLLLTQAQLALLREEQSVYEHSLRQVTALLRQYFQFNENTGVLIGEAEQLTRLNVIQPLPNLNLSLQAIKAFTKTQRNPALLQSAMPVEPESGGLR